VTGLRATQGESLRENAERLSSICSLRPFTPLEAEEATNTLLLIPSMLEALIIAKCGRWTMGTCVTRAVAEAEWCAVCRVLNSLGYEPYSVGDGGLESWREMEASRG
jgi:hypothetical protein